MWSGLLGQFIVPDSQQGHSVLSLEILLQRAKRVLGFTGAGASVESGIPAFRAPEDEKKKEVIWRNYSTEDFTLANFIKDENHRLRHWKVTAELFEKIDSAEPNGVHDFFARLHAADKLLGVVTQNIDGLHTRSGRLPLSKVVELHGNMTSAICLSCQSLFSLKSVLATDQKKQAEGSSGKRGVRWSALLLTHLRSHDCFSRLRFLWGRFETYHSIFRGGASGNCSETSTGLGSGGRLDDMYRDFINCPSSQPASNLCAVTSQTFGYVKPQSDSIRQVC
eukprot:g19660.t1